MRVRRLLAGVTVAAGLALAFPAGVGAALFEVNSLKDGVDANVADEACATAAGNCTLRAAIDEANDEPGDDDIKLPKGTIELRRPAGPASDTDNAEGNLNVAEAVEIDGRGPGKTVITQTVGDGVLDNEAGILSLSAFGLRLNDLTLAGGRIGGAGEDGGGGLDNAQVALLDNVVVRDNVARSDEFDDVGGAGIYSEGLLGLSDSAVRDNVARGIGSSHPSGAGIVIHDGDLSLQNDSAVVRNSIKFRDRLPGAIAQGGGLIIRNPGAEVDDSVFITDSTIADNSALGGPLADSGGIKAGPGVNLEIQRSTIARNRSRQAGGMQLVGVASTTIDNSTLSGNSDAGRGGAAIFFQSGTGTINITQTTIAGNRSSDGRFPVEPGEQASDSSLRFTSSIISNPGPECGGADADAFDAYATSGYNVWGNQCGPFNDLVASPKLKPLGDYGGPTATHALKPSSPAIDLVTGCSPGIDQRGISRPQGADCDAGSFERDGG